MTANREAPKVATVQAWQSITKEHVQCLQYELLASGNEWLLNYSKTTTFPQSCAKLNFEELAHFFFFFLNWLCHRNLLNCYSKKLNPGKTFCSISFCLSSYPPIHILYYPSMHQGFPFIVLFVAIRHKHPPSAAISSRISHTQAWF